MATRYDRLQVAFLLRNLQNNNTHAYRNKICALVEPEGMMSSDEAEFEANSFIKSQVVSLLPDCILLDIFRFLDVKQLSKCAQVCSQWRRVAQDRSLFHKVDLSDKSLSVREVQKFLHRFPCVECVRDLRLRGFLLAGGMDWNKPTITPATLSLLCQKMPRLACLTIENTLFKNSSNFISIDNFPSTLHHLGLRGTRFNPSLILGWSPGMVLTNVQCLDLGQCSILSSLDLHRLSHWTSLHCLYLDGCYRINSGGLEYLLPLLNQLTLLDIEKTDVSDEGIEFVIENGHMLTELYLGSNSLTDNAFSKVNKQLLTKLRVLCISDTQVTVDCINNLKGTFPMLTVINQKRKVAFGPKVQKWCHHHLHHNCENFRKQSVL